MNIAKPSIKRHYCMLADRISNLNECMSTHFPKILEKTSHFQIILLKLETRNELNLIYYLTAWKYKYKSIAGWLR